jgi:hypothetical protein
LIASFNVNPDLSDPIIIFIMSLSYVTL